MAKVTLYLKDEALWLAFRKACLDHKTSASRELVQMIRQLLGQWEQRKDQSGDSAIS